MLVRRFSAGTGRHALEAVAVATPRGVTVTVASVEHGHVGATAQALPRPEEGRTATTSVLAVPCHRDDVPAHDMAAALATRLRVPVAVSAGMHVDDATRDDIEALLANARELTEQIASCVGSPGTGAGAAAGRARDERA